MMGSINLLFIIIATFFVYSLRGSECTDLCDLEFMVSPTTEICATDNKTYKAPLSAIVGLPDPWACYRDCGLGVLYPGPCGCPNNCGSAVKRGACVHNTCDCKKGWGGADCNSISCPNSCSRNGKCHSVDKNLDICKCDKGFTGIDCSIPTLNLPLLPYGEILPNTSYYKKDKYGDNHPIFNISVIGNWYIEVDPAAFDSLLQPENAWNQSKQDATIYFTNGNVDQAIEKASIKLKGHFARLGVKKSFKLKIKDDFFGIETLVLKASSLDGTYLKNQINVEYFRSMMVPSARSSFATLTINGIFWGLYWMKEELDENFIHSRYGNDKGNFYGMNKYLYYFGENEELYKNCTDNQIGDFNCYQEEFGDGNWSDLIALAKFENKTSNKEFKAKIDQIFNVDNFLRAMVVLSAIDDPDSFTRNGNNWALYDDPDAKVWQFVPKDFEFSMVNPINNANASVRTNEKALLAYRIMAIPDYEDLFNQYFREFLAYCMSPKLGNATVARVSELQSFLLPIIETDTFFHITFGLPVTNGLWLVAVKELQLFLETRYISLEWQFNRNLL